MQHYFDDLSEYLRIGPPLYFVVKNYNYSSESSQTNRLCSISNCDSNSLPNEIVSKDLSEPVRSHKDLDKDAAPYFRKAVQFYDELAKQLVSQEHVLDLFASALDQVGVAEMKVVIERTGGLVVLSECFGHSVFKDSFRRVFEDGEQSLGLSFKFQKHLWFQIQVT